MSLIRFFAILKKEFIHIKRDKASLTMVILMPILFIFLFGYAINTDVKNIETAVLDLDNSLKSREIIDKFKYSEFFSIKTYLKNQNEMKDNIDSGFVKAIIFIPSGFEKDFYKNEAKIQFIIDGSNPTISQTAYQNGNLLSQYYNIKLNTNYIQKFELSTKVWFNPSMKNELFNIPGLIGLTIQNITVMLTAFSLVREKEKGTFELLMVTPIKSTELILGKIIPYILIGTFDFLISLFFGTIWFDVNINGNLILLIFLGICFVICSLSIGMLISSSASTQTQAMQMTMLFILPSVLLSGFVFPRESMPFFIKIWGNFIPLTYFLNISRGIILKGISLKYLLKDVFALLSFTFFLLFIACIKFKKRTN